MGKNLAKILTKHAGTMTAAEVIPNQPTNE
jgi:hypothetical protein